MAKAELGYSRFGPATLAHADHPNSFLEYRNRLGVASSYDNLLPANYLPGDTGTGAALRNFAALLQALAQSRAPRPCLSGQGYDVSK